MHRAHDMRLDRTLAMKVLSAHTADRQEVRKPFEREARGSRMNCNADRRLAVLGTDYQLSCRCERRTYVMPTIPQGYVQCEVCREFNGSTDARNLSWPGGHPATGQVSVTCLCHGIPCPRCKTRLIHRPITNTFYPESNSIEHTPYFWGMFPCKECRAKERERTKGGRS